MLMLKSKLKKIANSVTQGREMLVVHSPTSDKSTKMTIRPIVKFVENRGHEHIQEIF
jgi:hypothetical protein